MTRRPSFIRCAACGEDKPSKGAREAQVAWCRPFDGEGSHTDPQELQRLQIYVCGDCWRARHTFGEGEVPYLRTERRRRLAWLILQDIGARVQGSRDPRYVEECHERREQVRALNRRGRT